MKRFEWERAVLASDLTANARLVALVLATRADPDLTIPDAFSPSLSTLTELTDLGRSTMARALTELEGRGWVKRSRPTIEDARTKHARTGYALLVPDGASATAGLGLVPERDVPSATAGLAREGLVPHRDQAGPTPGLGLVPQRDTSQHLSRSSRTAAAAAADPLADYGLTDDERAAFMAYIGARSGGLLISLERQGQLAARVAEWQDARNARPKGGRSEWDRVPTVAELRARDAAELAADGGISRRPRGNGGNDYIDRW